MAKSMIIRTLYRESANGEKETLHFDQGVNLIVGSPNTGKTVWLKMLDYLLGDNGGPETAFDEDLVEKFVAIGAQIDIGDEKLNIERRWDEGPKTKVRIGEATYTSKEFSNLWLEKLEIPIINYPKGNPYAERAWTSLSWRELLRHIYRDERFWSDIVPKQPEATSHAALALFLGLEDRLFSPILGKLVNKQKELYQARARKDSFEETVDQIAKELMSEQDRDEHLTALTLNARIKALEEQVTTLLQEREEVLASNQTQRPDPTLSALMSERADLLISLEQAQKQGRILGERLDEVENLIIVIGKERDQLVRASVAGSAFSDLKITHCPACDQKLPTRDSTLTDDCFLCHQKLNSESTLDRIAFEQEQLEQEEMELIELRSGLEEQVREQQQLERQEREKLDLVVRDLRPAQKRLSAVVNTHISRIDTERGRVEERIRQLQRFNSLLTYRDNLTNLIDRLAQEVKELEAENKKLEAKISFEEASTMIEESMNHFVNLLNHGIEKYQISDRFRWNHGPISLDISERSSRFRVSGQKWSLKLGATVQVHFLLAYHFALLRLSLEQNTSYPGIVILDFPPNLLDSKTIGDKENYLIDPFVQLCKESSVPMQVIVAGRVFEGLESSTRTRFKHVWP